MKKERKKERSEPKQAKNAVTIPLRKRNKNDFQSQWIKLHLHLRFVNCQLELNIQMKFHVEDNLRIIQA